MRTSHSALRNRRRPRRAPLLALATSVLLGAGMVAGTPPAASAGGPATHHPAGPSADADGGPVASVITTLARPRWTAGAVPLG